MNRAWKALGVLGALLGLNACGYNPDKVGGCKAGPHDDWLQDFDAALAQSRKTGKPILADFEGSDWCGPCMQMARDLFRTAEFKQRVGDKYVLLQVDFPNGPQSDCLREQNQALGDHYGIKSLPTIAILGSNGEGRAVIIGYGGAVDFYRNLQSAESQLAQRDKQKTR